LNTVVVPDDYNQFTQLGSFAAKYRPLFYYYNDSISDGNYNSPTDRLRAGDKIRVRAFKQVVSGTMATEDRMTFLRSQNALLPGAQGAALVFDLLRDQLPKGYWYVSFDEKSGLWSDAAGHGIPIIDAHSADAYGFRLGRYQNRWRDVDITLCFTKADP
jgi:hypothetical protein